MRKANRSANHQAHADALQNGLHRFSFAKLFQAVV
jgi:hypothetical protein